MPDPAPNSRKRNHLEDHLTFIVFYPRAPPTSTAAGDLSTSSSRTISINHQDSPTASNSQPRKSNKYSSSRETAVLYTSLGASNLRHLDIGSGEGLPTRFGTNTLPDQPRDISSKISTGTSKDGDRNQNAENEEGDSSNSTTDGPVHKQVVHDFEEGQVTSPSDKSKASKSIYHRPTLQDGRGSQSEGVTEER